MNADPEEIRRLISTDDTDQGKAAKNKTFETQRNGGSGRDWMIPIARCPCPRLCLRRATWLELRGLWKCQATRSPQEFLNAASALSIAAGRSPNWSRANALLKRELASPRR